MSQPRLLLVGAGGHARACIDVIESTSAWTIIGLVGLVSEVGTCVLGYPVLGDDTELPSLLARCDAALVTVGQIKSADARRSLFAHIESAGRVPSAIVSPRAHVSRHAVIGHGTIVMHGAVVNASARVGCNGILNTLSLVEHDVVVGDHCHVSTHAAINSGVIVGEGTFLGSGSLVRQGLHIGAGSVIGMGQCVVKDCPPGTRLPVARPQ